METPFVYRWRNWGTGWLLNSWLARADVHLKPGSGSWMWPWTIREWPDKTMSEGQKYIIGVLDGLGWAQYRAKWEGDSNSWTRSSQENQGWGDLETANRPEEKFPVVEVACVLYKEKACEWGWRELCTGNLSSQLCFQCLNINKFA